MQNAIENQPNCSPITDTLEVWRLEAKSLHREACHESLARSLPVLRRLLATETLNNLSLPELKRDTSIVKRKHLLHMLAKEHGHANWAACKEAISVSTTPLLPYSQELKGVGYPLLWFSNQQQAEDYQQQHGGKVVIVGTQAIVVE